MNYSTTSRRRTSRRSWRNPGGSRSAVSFGQLQVLRASTWGDSQIDYSSGRIRATGKLIADTPARELLDLLDSGSLTVREADMVSVHLKRLPEHATFEDATDPSVLAWIGGQWL